MPETNLQTLCERGQIELMETRYLDAVATLKQAEQQAWDQRDFDTLCRLYLPLQEARRQIRQRCGDAVTVVLPGWSSEWIDDQTRQGQLLLAGRGSIQPAVEMRQLALDRKLYVEVLLGAYYPLEDDSQLAIVISPLSDTQMPVFVSRPLEELKKILPFGCVAVALNQLSNSFLLSPWEHLHGPYMAAAKIETDPIRQMEAYRLTLRVDPGCELAHQFLANIARRLARSNSKVVY